MSDEVDTVFPDAADVCSPRLFSDSERSHAMYVGSMAWAVPAALDAPGRADAQRCVRCGASQPDSDVRNVAGKLFCSLACKFVLECPDDAASSLLAMAGPHRPSQPSGLQPVRPAHRSAPTRAPGSRRAVSPRPALPPACDQQMFDGRPLPPLRADVPSLVRTSDAWRSTAQDAVYGPGLLPGTDAVQPSGEDPEVLRAGVAGLNRILPHAAVPRRPHDSLWRSEVPAVPQAVERAIGGPAQTGASQNVLPSVRGAWPEAEGNPPIYPGSFMPAPEAGDAGAAAERCAQALPTRLGGESCWAAAPVAAPHALAAHEELAPEGPAGDVHVALDIAAQATAREGLLPATMPRALEAACDTCGHLHVGEYGAGQYCSANCAKRRAGKRGRSASRQSPAGVRGVGSCRSKRIAPSQPAAGASGLSPGGGHPKPSPSKRARAPALPPNAPHRVASIQIKCALCRAHVSLAKAVLHPVLAQQPLRLCWKCGDTVVDRLRQFTAPTPLGATLTSAVNVMRVEGDLFQDREGEARGPTVVAHAAEGERRAPADADAKAVDARDASRGAVEARQFVAVVEELLYMSPAASLAAKGVSDVLVRGEADSSRASCWRDLGIPIDMLAVVRAVLTRLGMTFENGKLSWPLDSIAVPPQAEVVCMVELALPRSAADRAAGTSAGARVWNETFPSAPWSRESVQAREVFGLVLGLIGVSLAPPRRSSGRHGEVMHLDPVSISTAMHSASDRAGDVELQALFDTPQLVVPRALTRARQCEAESRVMDDPTASDLCCCCGSTREPTLFPFRLVPCRTCPKHFCTLCLGVAFGIQEYQLACRAVPFECQQCRLAAKVLALTNVRGVVTGVAANSKVRRRQVGAAVDAGGAPPLPLLIVVPQIAVACNGLAKDGVGTEERRRLLSFALFCEAVNDSLLSQTSGRAAAADARSFCFSCKGRVCPPSPVPSAGGAVEEQGRPEGGVACAAVECRATVHRSCVPKDDSSSSAWQCALHECSVCAGTPTLAGSSSSVGDEICSPLPVLTQCRTCATSFCDAHLPDWKHIHVYGNGWIACPDCAPKLEAPKLSPRQLRAAAQAADQRDGKEPSKIAAYMLSEIERRGRRVDSYAALLRGLATRDDVGAVQFAQTLRKKKTHWQGRLTMGKMN